MSWKFIFNANVGETVWISIEEVKMSAKKAGYHFFCFEKWVYHIDGKKTNIQEKDCF